jgi:excisionase family DNA binding protein
MVTKLKSPNLFPWYRFCCQINEKQKKGGKLMSLMEKDVVLTTNEAIEYLKISKPTFLKYIHIGRIKAIKAGNGWRVLQSELYRFLGGEER